MYKYPLNINVSSLKIVLRSWADKTCGGTDRSKTVCPLN